MKILIVTILLMSMHSYAEDVMTVYKRASCGCCAKWAKHLKENGFKVKEIAVNDLDQIKKKYKVPSNKRSCHTAVYGKHVFEGHVPASSIKKFLKSKNKALGLVVPDMPMGSPGMEHGNHRDKYTVFTFDKEGKTKSFEKF